MSSKAINHIIGHPVAFFLGQCLPKPSDQFGSGSQGKGNSETKEIALWTSRRT